ncbi:MAG: class I SAM-dependent methyltransferase [Acidobacteria bacterium]|nr:class I SAM-dependent methyltransferase [Acidobacteriota bacterium]
MTEDLKAAETHFAFGRNWASYSSLIGEAEVDDAAAALSRLLGHADLTGRTFLDIGCGSGLHSLAALRLGASRVLAVDIDADSVATTRNVLSRFAPEASCQVERRSVFDLDPAPHGHFDVVYSWGVLHHTGEMAQALRMAAAMVAPGGVFLFALYRRTHLCGLWTIEKRWYAKASPRAQRVAQEFYMAVHRLLTGASAWLRGSRRKRGERRERGMDARHDVHDWLGGYPYESILPDEVDALMQECGLQHEATFLCTGTRGRTHGLLGSGCDEYRYGRHAASGHASPSREHA